MEHLHKRCTDSQVRELIERYLREEIARDYIQESRALEKRGYSLSSMPIDRILMSSRFSIKERPNQNNPPDC
jgi:hypothetical protein